MNTLSKTTLWAVVIAIVATFAGMTPAFAELTAAGPTDPQTGFPTFYQDSNGVALQIGLDPLFNFFDPVIAGNAFSQQIGFGAEAFYFLAEATLDLGGGNSALIVMGMEAAFATGDPVNGQQFPFNRLRIRVDAPTAGTYTVTHPYGVETFTVDTPGIRAINLSIDIGGVMPDAATALSGRVGPFLRAVNPAPPVGHIGNINILQTVTGSPFGTNFFRVRGPLGLDVQTNQFSIGGKIFTGVVGAPLTVTRATYEKAVDNSGNIDVFANSTPTAAVSIAAAGVVPATNMLGDGAGKFFTRIHLADATVLPATLTVTATDTGLNPTSIIKTLVDKVEVTGANYDAGLRTLTVTAVTGDLLANPALTVVGLGPIAGGTLALADVTVPPASVTVESAAGGSDTHNVVVNGTIPVNQAPAAAADTINTLINTAAANVNLLANDVDPDGTIDAATLAVTQPANGVVVKNVDNTVTFTPAVGFTGTTSFTYTVNDNLGAVSNSATVTVNVSNAAAAANTPPVATADTASVAVETAITINLVANDTDADGTVSAASVVIEGLPVSGTVVNNANGTVTYTSNAGFTGTDSFTYNVKDNLGAVSNTATVTVTVANAAPPAPTNLTAATAVQADPAKVSVTLNWQEAAATLTGFTLQRSRNAGFTTALVNFNLGPNVRTFRNQGLLRGTTYFYRIRANNASGSSAWTTVTVVTP